MQVVRAAIQNIVVDDLHKLNPASPAAEARRVPGSLVKWSLNGCNNVYKFLKPFLTTWKSSLLDV